MAKQTITRLIDDLDGGEATETVTFALDGIAWTIDLSEVHAKELREVFAPYVDAGTRTTSRVTRSASEGVTARRDENQAIRDWAGRNGWAISLRGRIPVNVVNAYRAAR